jgi:protein-S-isoprenylcysteine O-methyltransferase Ste14
VALIWVGIVFRYWSVRTLGRFFTVTVDVGEDHQLVDTGPYALLRHPSYTGMLVVYLGIGVGLDSWLSVATALLIPLAAVLNRIRHEEAVLRAQLGPQYERYATRTSRLLPGIW